jgi:hypothetical protein
MANYTQGPTLSRAALIAAIAYILMMASPFAEFMVYQKLVVPGNAALTAKNILANQTLFNVGIFAYLVNFIGDILAAWALYILLRPVNANLSLLTAWTRLIYTVISLAALLNLLTVAELLHTPDYLKVFDVEKLQAQAMLSLNEFRNGWSFAFIFFGIHLILLGYLAFISKYIPKLIGIFLIVAGLGWLADNLQPFLYPHFNVNVGMIAGFGELIFLFWLLIMGWRIKDIPFTPATSTTP